LIKKGTGGRSSVSGHTATVFGATGFLGRYVVSKLAKQGTVVVCPNRDPDAFRTLKVTGDLGMVVPLDLDLKDPYTIEEAVRNSDIVYNLIGREWETKNFTFEDIHITAPTQIAEAVVKYNVDRLVHVSSFNADTSLDSQYYKTKALGEEAVKSVFPQTTIVRPGPMFGWEDRFLRKLASRGFLFTANHNTETVRPIYVNDVALALEIMMHEDTTAGQTYELCSDHEYTLAEIVDIVETWTVRRPRHINLPKPVFLAVAAALERLWWPTITRDEIRRQFINHTVSRTAKTWRDIPGMHAPSEFNAYSLNYLKNYRHPSTYQNQILENREPRGRVYGTD